MNPTKASLILSVTPVPFVGLQVKIPAELRCMTDRNSQIKTYLYKKKKRVFWRRDFIEIIRREGFSIRSFVFLKEFGLTSLMAKT